MFQRKTRRKNNLQKHKSAPLVGRREYLDLSWKNNSRSLSPPRQRHPDAMVHEEQSPLYHSQEIEMKRFLSTGSDTCTRRTSLALTVDQEERDDDESSCSTNEDNGNWGSQDMIFSLTSNLFFLAGACIQTYCASWDVWDAVIDEEWDAHTSSPTYVDDITSAEPMIYITLYAILSSIGPFLFMMNALVDGLWALSFPPGHPTNGRRCVIFRHAMQRPEALDQEEEEDQESLQEELREKRWEFAGAAIFGLGATLEFCGTFYEYGTIGEVYASKINIVSMHTYLISGLLHLQKDRKLIMVPGGSVARVLKGSGMILFLTGSILDCVISYLYDPELVSGGFFTPVTLAVCNLFSSVLWTINAIFYVCADCLVFDVVSKWRYWWRTTFTGVRQRMSQPGERVEIPGGLSLPLLDVLGPKSPKEEHGV